MLLCINVTFLSDNIKVTFMHKSILNIQYFEIIGISKFISKYKVKRSKLEPFALDIEVVIIYFTVLLHSHLNSPHL